MINPQQNSLQPGLGFKDIVDLLVGHWRTVVGSVVGMTVLGLFYIWAAPPTFKAEALIQAESQKQKDPALGEIALLLGGDQTPVTGEIQIVQSRLVLNQVIDELGLEIIAYPKHLPIIGAAVARHARKDGLNKPFPFFSHYAWGGERIAADVFDVPEDYLETEFTIEAGQDGAFKLYDPRMKEILGGTVGKQASAPYAGGTVNIQLRELVARPGTRFAVSRTARYDLLKSIDNHLTVAEAPRGSSLFSVVYDCENAKHCVDVLNAVINAYVKQNIDRKSADSAKTLDFLRDELPQLSTKLRVASENLAAFLRQHGSVNLDAQTQLVLQQAIALENSRVALQLEHEDLTRRFTDKYPAAAALQAQIDHIDQESARYRKQIDTLPSIYRDYLTLNLEVQADTTLYNGVLSSIQNLELEKAGQIGTVRVVDGPIKPVRRSWPIKAVVVAGSILTGLFLGILLVVIRRAMDVGVVDPAHVERELGLPSYATIPFSEEQNRIGKLLSRNNTGSILAATHSDDIAVESLRSLRTALQFAIGGAESNIVSLTGPEPGLGKSFVSMNLGAVMAAGDKTVVVIDGDMRRGHLNKYIGQERAPGLSDYIAGKATAEQILRETPVKGLYLVPTGTIPPNPTELLMSERFQEFLALMSQRFNHVLIDTPPVLAVTDAAVLGKLSAATLMVLKTGKHPMRIIDESLKRLRQSGVTVKGAVFNQTTFGQGRYGYGYGYGDVYRYYTRGYKYSKLDKD